MPGSSGQSSGIRQELERTRKEKPPASGGDILAGDVADLSRHIEPFEAPGTLRLYAGCRIGRSRSLLMLNRL